MVERSDSRTCGRWERDEGERTRRMDGDGLDEEGDISLRKSGSKNGGIFVDLRAVGEKSISGWRNGDKFRTPDIYSRAWR